MIELDRLAQALKTGWNIDAESIQQITGGLDSSAWNFRAGNWFVKVRTDAAVGLTVAFELASAGIESVSAPIWTHDKRICLELDGHFIYVFPFFEGKNGFERELALQNWESLGVELRKIHKTPFPMPEYTRIEFDFNKWDEFLSLFEKLKRSTVEVQRLMYQVISEQMERLETVHLTIRELGRACYEQDENFCVCHGDIHVGNLLATQDQIRIVDWDHPRFAPKECDLMFFLQGGIMKHSLAEEESFLRGYGEVEIDWNALNYFRFERLFDDVLAFMADVMNDRYSEEEKQESVRLCYLLFEPGYLYDVAESGYSVNEP